MKKDKRMIVSLIWLMLGMILSGLGLAGIADEFWSGMGSALLVVGILGMIRFRRLQNNPVYREKMEIANNDERNHFIRSKAWAWAGYLFVLAVSVSIIVFKLIGQETLSMAASAAVCFLLVLYWVSYLVLSKKY